MSTQATLAFINLDGTLKHIDLVNDGDEAGEILANHYNNYNAARALTSGGVISILRPALQDCIFHAFNWGRELTETNTTVDILSVFADVLTANGGIVYVFDAREYYADYSQYDEFHYHKMYGSSSSNTKDKQYWKKLNPDGTLTAL